MQVIEKFSEAVTELQQVPVNWILKLRRRETAVFPVTPRPPLFLARQQSRNQTMTTVVFTIIDSHPNSNQSNKCRVTGGGGSLSQKHFSNKNRTCDFNSLTHSCDLVFHFFFYK